MIRKIALLGLVALLLVEAWLAHADGPVTLGSGSLTALALSPDGARLAVGSTVGLYFFNAQTFAPNGFWATPYRVEQVIWSPRGDTLALVNGGDVEARQAQTGAVLWKNSYGCQSCQVTFSRDGSQVVVLRGENTASVYDLTSGRLAETFRGDSFWALAEWRTARLAASNWQSPEGELAVMNGSAWVYRVPGRETLAKVPLTYIGKLSDRPERIALSPDGQLLATSEAYGRVRLWSLKDTSTPKHGLTGYADDDSLHAFAWSPDSAVLYVARGNVLYAWDAKTGQRLRSLGGLFAEAVNHVTWSAGGRHVIAVQGQQLGVWDLATRQLARAAWLSDYAYPARQIAEVLASPRGDLLAIADSGGVTLYETATLSRVRRLPAGHPVTALAFSADGGRLATGGAGLSVTIWDTETGQSLLDLPASPDCCLVAALAYSADGQRVYALESNGQLRQWELKTGASRTAQMTLPWNGGSYDSAMSLNARRLATTWGSAGIDVTDVEAGQRLYTLPAPYARSVVINAQGTRLAAIVDANVKIWKLDTGELSAAYGEPAGSITAIAFSPDGKDLAGSSADGTIKVWPVP